MLEFNWFDHAFVLMIVIVVPIMSLKSEQMTAEMIKSLPPKKHLFYTNGLMLIIGALLVLTSWNISGRSWNELGFALISMNESVKIFCSILIVFYLSDLILGFFNIKYLESRLEDLHFIIPLNWQEFRSYIFLAVSAGICEEIIFRGFLITYFSHFLAEVPYGQYVAILIPALVFSVSHIYQGWWAVLKILILALLFGYIFIFSESLIAVIIIHIMIDIFSGIAGVLGHKNVS